MIRMTLYRFYRISSPNSDRTYIGLTTELLSRRMSGHYKDERLRQKTGTGGCRSREILNAGEAKIQKLYEIELESKTEAELYECILQKLEGEKCVNDYQKYFDRFKEKTARQKRRLDYNQQKSKCSICGNEVSNRNMSRHKKRVHNYGIETPSE